MSPKHETPLQQWAAHAETRAETAWLLKLSEKELMALTLVMLSDFLDFQMALSMDDDEEAEDADADGDGWKH